MLITVINAFPTLSIFELQNVTGKLSEKTLKYNEAVLSTNYIKISWEGWLNKFVKQIYIYIICTCISDKFLQQLLATNTIDHNISCACPVFMVFCFVCFHNTSGWCQNVHTLWMEHHNYLFSYLPGSESMWSYMTLHSENSLHWHHV